MNTVESLITHTPPESPKAMGYRGLWVSGLDAAHSARQLHCAQQTASENTKTGFSGSLNWLVMVLHALFFCFEGSDKREEGLLDSSVCTPI